MKSLRYHVESIARRLTRRRRFPLVVKRRGAKFVLDPRNWLDRHLAMWRPYEDDLIAHAAATMERERLNVFIDIGANFGIYTVLLGRLPFVTEVIAFEPVRRNFNQLLANVFANRLDGKVEAHRLAWAKPTNPSSSISIRNRRRSRASIRSSRTATRRTSHSGRPWQSYRSTA